MFSLLYIVSISVWSGVWGALEREIDHIRSDRNLAILMDIQNKSNLMDSLMNGRFWLVERSYSNCRGHKRLSGLGGLWCPSIHSTMRSSRWSSTSTLSWTKNGNLVNQNMDAIWLERPDAAWFWGFHNRTKPEMIKTKPEKIWFYLSVIILTKMPINHWIILPSTDQSYTGKMLTNQNYGFQLWPRIMLEFIPRNGSFLSTLFGTYLWTLVRWT